MRAVLYTRVSTDEQAQHGYSLPSQLEACQRYAAEHGFEVVAEFADDYTGTVPIEARPEGGKAYKMLAGGEADALVAYRIDRIVRPPEEGDEWDMPILIRGLAKLGKELHTCDRGKLGTSFADLLLAMLDARSAGEERRNLIERSKRGRETKIRNGKPYVGGGAPYGYRPTTDGYFEVVEREAEVIRMIFTWYAQGDGDGEPLGMCAIARKLSEMGVPTPEGGRPRSKHKAGIWSEFVIYYILTREAYTGVKLYGANKVPVSMPVILSRELFETAQERREYNRKMSPRNNKVHFYLLRGMVSCGCGCGLSYTGYTNGKGDRYYYVREHVLRGLEKPRCTATKKLIRAEILEDTAWQYILDAIANSEELESRLREAQRLELEAKQPKRERLSLALEMIAEAEAEAGKLAQAIARSPGGIVGDALERQAADVNARHVKLCRERDNLQAEIEAQELTDGDIADVVSFWAAVKAGLENATLEERRYYLETLRFHTTIKGSEAHHTCYLAAGDSVFDLKASRDL